MARGKAKLSVEAVERLAITALRSGGSQRGFRRIDWDISGRCERPVTVQVHSRATERLRNIRTGVRKHMCEVTMEVRCRQCPTCLKQRSIKWTQRAVAEMSVAGRTWFGTLTLSPEKHTWVEAKLRSDFQKSGDFDALTEKEKFAARLKLIGEELTLFIKRIRKNGGSPLKYILVAERHKSGLPHFHVLIHEAPGHPIRKNKVLDRAWSWGFSKFALAETKHAYYVCKYLTKSSEARVRASFHYGEIDALPETTL